MASADDEGLNDFNFLLSSNASKRLFDDHLWFSVAKRPTPSRLSRVQRLSICIVVLFLCMISNAMWFREEDDTTSGIQLGPIKITFRQVWVGLMSSVLVVPPTLIIMEVFKRSKPRNSCTTIFPYVRDSDENESKSTSADDGKFHSAVQKLITKEMQDKSKSKRADKGFEILVDLQMELEEEEKTKSKEKKIRKKPIRFPWWSVVFGYVLAFLAVATSAFFVLLYSLEWGPEKSTNWLISLFFSFSQSIILVQPLKVLLAAVLMACLLRMPGDEEEEEDMMIAEHKLQDVIPPKPHSIPVADKVIDLEDMRARKKARRRDQRLTGKLREIFIHLLYLCLLVLICFANRDRNFFRQNYNLRNSLDLTDDNFAKVQRIETIFSWLNDTIFPAVFPTENYNGDLYTEADDLAFVRDMRGLRLGPLRLRQQRVKEDSCNVVNPMNKFLNGCNPMISGGDMDKGAYGPGWVTTASNSTSQLAQAFMFSPPNGPNDQTVYGQVDHYEGGGYMVEVSSANDSVHILTSLKDLNWIDRLTRAVIVEFTVNNANVNVFSMVRIIVELPAVGGIFIKKELVSFRPYPYVDPFDFVLLLVQVIWAVLVFVLLGMEVVKMVKLKKKYCQQLWHFIELGDLCLAITSMVCFVLRTVYTIRSVEDVKNNGGHFVGFDLVANWDNAYTVIIAIDLFLATLQLFRPLTFNKHLAIVQSALIRAFIAVTTYMVIFGILLFSYAQALQLIAGQVIAAFRALPYAMFNLFGVMLGVLKYSNIITSESLLVSIFFTAFTMTMNFIILNMFISIINDGLTEVKGNEELQDYDEELAEHVWSKMDAWIKAIFQRKDKSALGEPTQNEGSNSAKSSAKAPQVVITLAEEPVKQEDQERKKDPLIVKSEEGRALLVKANNQKLSVQKGRRARKLATANSLACLMEEKFLRVFHTYNKDETTREKWKRTIEEIRLKNHRQKIDKIGEKFVECRMHIHKLCRARTADHFGRTKFDSIVYASNQGHRRGSVRKISQ
ncbi:polycystic kidney disease protein 1-like 2 [Lingula anatina]|uniref:Polycystic kidney disease protein 1-like 2 n=1 Tax=Lingula anatina TaxID=7574 RepID=A0A1S3HJY3_LINAN|nr:polycystic kidney disease protein 1-like 2 [Lingula anatina]|eukprot:XP_013386430.1 polycystic kidney disease protein 1-like 2 [Lingula anatina]